MYVTNMTSAKCYKKKTFWIGRYKTPKDGTGTRAGELKTVRAFNFRKDRRSTPTVAAGVVWHCFTLLKSSPLQQRKQTKKRSLKTKKARKGE